MAEDGRNRLEELHRPALAVVLRYAAFGAAWIVLSEGLRARIRAMSLVHDQLYRSGDLESVSMADYVDALLSSLCDREGGCAFENRCGRAMLRLDDAVPFGLLLTELALNALAHAGPKAVFSIEAVEEAGRLRVIARDNGPGFPEATPGGSGSMGLALVESLARQLDGPVSFANEGGARIEFSIARRGTDGNLAAGPAAGASGPEA